MKGLHVSCTSTLLFSYATPWLRCLHSILVCWLFQYQSKQMATDQLRLFMLLVTAQLSSSLSRLFPVQLRRVRDKFALINAMSVDPLYLQHKHAEKAVDYRVRQRLRSGKHSMSLIWLFSIGEWRWVVDFVRWSFGSRFVVTVSKGFVITFAK